MIRMDLMNKDKYPYDDWWKKGELLYKPEDERTDEERELILQYKREHEEYVEFLKKRQILEEKFFIANSRYRDAELAYLLSAKALEEARQELRNVCPDSALGKIFPEEIKPSKKETVS